MSVNRLLQEAAAGAAGAGEASDDDFANVVLLLDGDGTSGDTNNTFTDSSTNGFTVTENGSVVQGSFSPYGDNWSNYFDGSSYLNTASGATALGTGNFTVEFWINTTDTSFNIMNPDSSTGNGFWGLMVQSGDLRWNNQYNLTNLWVVDGAPILDGNWHHVAIIKNSNVFKVFYDGVSQSIQSGSFTDPYNYPYSDGLRIGSGNLATFKGYLSNIRLVSGTAIYSSDFDVPTEPFTISASYTEKLLTCQSNIFKDNSLNEYSITLSGTPKVTPFSPFKNNDARDITTDGGSAYFDGTLGNYLDIPHNTNLSPSGDFTIEFWAYVTNSQTTQEWYSKGGGIQIYINNSKWGIALSASNNTSYFFSNNTAPVIPNMWTHVAVTREGNSYQFLINGVQVASTTSSSTPNTGTDVVRIGDWSGGTGYEAIGYISDVRYVNGMALYGAVLNTPTAPLTTAYTTTTELLLNFQDAGIYDRSGINNLDTVGTAQIDTAVKKYGTGSIEFDGNSDYLLGAENPANVLAIGGAFTAECWFYQTATAGTGTALHALIGQWNNATSNKAFVMGISNTSMILYVSNNGNINAISGATGGTVSNNTWNHAALTWDGTNYRVFLNGTAVITQANSSAPYSSNEVIQIGASKAGSGGAIAMFYQGYMDDVRITNGVARYTSNFTPPDAALPKF